MFVSPFFLFASSIKILGWQKKIFEVQLAMFVSYGFDRRFMSVVGFVELFGAIAIWFHSTPLAAFGAAAIMATSFSAIVCHLVYDTWQQGVPAMITLALSTFVAWNVRGPFMLLIGLPV